MSQQIGEAKSELEAAQSAVEAALRAWDESVSELWRTSLALTQVASVKSERLVQTAEAAGKGGGNIDRTRTK